MVHTRGRTEQKRTQRWSPHTLHDTGRAAERDPDRPPVDLLPTSAPSSRWPDTTRGTERSRPRPNSQSRPRDARTHGHPAKEHRRSHRKARSPKSRRRLDDLARSAASHWSQIHRFIRDRRGPSASRPHLARHATLRTRNTHQTCPTTGLRLRRTLPQTSARPARGFDRQDERAPVVDAADSPVDRPREFDPFESTPKREQIPNRHTPQNTPTARGVRGAKPRRAGRGGCTPTKNERAS